MKTCDDEIIILTCTCSDVCIYFYFFVHMSVHPFNQADALADDLVDMKSVLLDELGTGVPEAPSLAPEPQSKSSADGDDPMLAKSQSPYAKALAKAQSKKETPEPVQEPQPEPESSAGGVDPMLAKSLSPFAQRLANAQAKKVQGSE